MKSIFLILTFLLSLTSIAEERTESSQKSKIEEVRQSHFSNGVPYYPGVLGIPEAEYEAIRKGYEQRAQANIELAEILYGKDKEKERAELFERIPVLPKLLSYHSGFIEELLGKVNPAHLGRLYAPDIWAVRPPNSNQKWRVVVGEENGGNPGGIERLELLTKQFRANPEFGNVPNNEKMYERMVQHIHVLLESFKGKTQAPVIVYANEVGVSAQPVKIDGKEIKPPAPMPAESIADIKADFAKLGVTWLSLVDPSDKRRIFVEGTQLYLLDKDSKGREVKRKVDALFTRLDLESVDSTYKPQVERNERAGRGDMTEVGKLVGIPGLVEAWLANQNNPAKGFLWVNGLTSMLTTNKIWPQIVDTYIEKIKGQKVILPLLETITFFNEKTGEFDRAKLDKYFERYNDFVGKMTLGQGGKQVFFGEEILEEKERMIETLRKNPFSYVFQRRMELRSLELDFLGKIKPEKFYHDFRLLGLISPKAKTLMKQIMVRLSKSFKINVSLGGSLGMGGKAKVKKMQSMADNELYKSGKSLPQRRCIMATKGL